MSVIVVQRPALATGGVAAAAVHAYENAGGKGERTSIITLTSTFTGMPTSEAQNLINGIEHWNNVTYSADFSGSEAVSGKELRFQFTESKNISEFVMNTNNASTHGTWKFQGSTDGTVWVDQGSSFTLGGLVGANTYDVSGDSTLYTYFRLLGVSGNAASAPWIYSIDFKIKTATAESGPPTYDHFPGSSDMEDWATSISTTAALSGGDVFHFFDGKFGGANDVWFNGGQTLREIEIQFPEAYVFSEFEFHNNHTDSHGTWVLEGSNNGSTWTDVLTAAFTLGGATSQTETCTVFAAGHTYIRFRQTAGTTDSTPYIHGFKFKCVRAANYAP